MDNFIDSVSLVKEIYNSTYEYGISTCDLDGKINTWNVGAAQRMRRILRDSDFIARLGGDEFVLLQPNMRVIQAGAELAAKLNAVLSQPFDIGAREVKISGSIGIAICPDDAIDSDQLLKKADLALYRQGRRQGKIPLLYREAGFSRAPAQPRPCRTAQCA